MRLVVATDLLTPVAQNTFWNAGTSLNAGGQSGDVEGSMAKVAEGAVAVKGDTSAEVGGCATVPFVWNLE